MKKNMFWGIIKKENYMLRIIFLLVHIIKKRQKAYIGQIIIKKEEKDETSKILCFFL